MCSRFLLWGGSDTQIPETQRGLLNAVQRQRHRDTMPGPADRAVPCPLCNEKFFPAGEQREREGATGAPGREEGLEGLVKGGGSGDFVWFHLAFSRTGVDSLGLSQSFSS